MKKILPVLVMVLACIFIFASCNDKEVENLDPLPAQTIDINTAEDLSNINNYLGVKYINYTFSLKNDIDIASFTQWTPIGTKETPFMATFIGNGKTIRNLSYIGIDSKGEPMVAETISNIGLFGYTHNTNISGVTLTGVNINCYTSGDYFHTAGLVAYNVGTSSFSDISVAGNINLSNIYVYNTTYGMDGEIQDDRVISCDTTQYIGGLVAYSSGDTTFSGINVNMNINNKHYRAVYEIETTEIDGETVIESEGYNIHSYTGSAYLPSQTIVGLFGGYIKNQAKVTDVTVAGSMEIFAKSSYGASGIAILIGSTASNITSNNTNLICKGSEKVGVSGAIALIDSSTVSNMKVNTLTVNAEPVGGSVKNISIGGIASYCYDRAVLSNSEITAFTVTTTEKIKLQLGGVVGVVRDATITNSTAAGTFTLTGTNKVESADYNCTASIVYAAYGNAIVSENYADIDITLKNGITSLAKNVKLYGIVNNTPYVNEDGKTVARFAKVDNTKDYVEVFIEHDNANEITATYCNNEGVILATVIFTVDESLYTGSEENCFKYMSAYYADSVGLLDEKGAVLVIDGISFADYEQITGVPVFNGNTIVG